MNRYVLGFAFSSDRTRVALIRKVRPKWQENRLNGIGGKRESGELSVQAMVREFYEETGMKTVAADWRTFAKMIGNDWSVDCFAMYDCELDDLKTTTDEDIMIVNVMDVIIGAYGMIDNLKWLVPLALDEFASYTSVNYKNG